MAERAAAKLYTPSMLSLATQLADFPLNREFTHRAERRSRTCGSTIELGVDLGGDGRVSGIGMQVGACAVGQSSAAIMALGVKGRSPEEILETQTAIEGWLSADGSAQATLPDWPGFDTLRPAREYPARHSALLLAWTAITQALSSSASSR